MKWRGSATSQGEPSEAKATPSRRVMTGDYVLLYKYLENRYADTLVLTFAQIEDLLGFALPAPALLRPDWWSDAPSGDVRPAQSDSWTLAGRTATPNLAARIVVFERVF